MLSCLIIYMIYVSSSIYVHLCLLAISVGESGWLGLLHRPNALHGAAVIFF